MSNPIFKIALKIISHRFRVIQAKGLKILGAKVFSLFLQNFVYCFFQNHEFFFCFFVHEILIFFMINYRILHAFAVITCCGAAVKTRDYGSVVLRSNPMPPSLFY